MILSSSPRQLLCYCIKSRHHGIQIYSHCYQLKSWHFLVIFSSFLFMTSALINIHYITKDSRCIGIYLDRNQLLWVWATVWQEAILAKIFQECIQPVHSVPCIAIFLYSSGNIDLLLVLPLCPWMSCLMRILVKGHHN